ncbi:unnamed protein product [Thelazia callipaeda]|uniref:TAF4 domain-containing protein n=1 Tax=Thelazia callipaeda TaxID=103827 RepID=A0A0N5CUW8_THECL|nr:unnamed protein product [Thelazia callipaeda]
MTCSRPTTKSNFESISDEIIDIIFLAAEDKLRILLKHAVKVAKSRELVERQFHESHCELARQMKFIETLEMKRYDDTSQFNDATQQGSVESIEKKQEIHTQNEPFTEVNKVPSQHTHIARGDLLAVIDADPSYRRFRFTHHLRLM